VVTRATTREEADDVRERQKEIEDVIRRTAKMLHARVDFLQR
jgi:hypothetical protein